MTERERIVKFIMSLVDIDDREEEKSFLKSVNKNIDSALVESRKESEAREMRIAEAVRDAYTASLPEGLRRSDLPAIIKEVK